LDPDARSRLRQTRSWSENSRCSYDLEIARKLPIGDSLVVFARFPNAGAHVVIDERLAEQGTRGFAAAELVGGFAQRARKLASAVCSRVAARLGRQSQTLFDAPQPSPERRGHGDVRVHVRRRLAMLDAQRAPLP